MNYIPLPTDAPEQREIIKALIEANSERLEFQYVDGPGTRWMEVATLLGRKLEDYQFRLIVPDPLEKLRCPDSPSASTGVDLPVPLGTSPNGLSGTISESVFICGFDEQGRREVMDKTGHIPDGAVRYSLSTIHYKTRRPKPDCPCCNVKKEEVSEIREEGVSEKPELDLSKPFLTEELHKEAMRLKQGRLSYEPAVTDWIYLQLAQINLQLRKIEAHANGRVS